MRFTPGLSAFAVAVSSALATLTAFADDDHAGHDPHHRGLFFPNPLTGETPSPHSELRFKYILEHDEGSDVHSFEAGIEFAFARWISVELEAPYVVVADDGRRASHFDSLGVALKLATFAFEDRGLLLGGGIEIELPTGDEERDIGSDHVIVAEPFVTAGLQLGEHFALTTRVGFGFPFNEESDEKDDVDLAIGYHVALFWFVSDRVTLLLELDGETVASGDEDEDLLNISPGIKLRPFDSDVEIGAAVSFPLLDDPGFDVRFTFAVFLHF